MHKYIMLKNLNTIWNRPIYFPKHVLF